MKSIFGDAIQISLFGESHSDAMGVVINGLAPGITIDLDFMRYQLEKRKPKGRISTQRHELDEVKIVSGLVNRHTTGTPLCLMIENKSQRSGDYEKTKDLLRPSHADFTAFEKYFGFQDYRGGGHFSGRLTAPLVAAGAIFIQILRDKGIELLTHVKELHGVADEPFSGEEETLRKQLERLRESELPALSEEVWDQMRIQAEEAANEGDSVGGILETGIVGIPAGIGEPFFGSVESKLSSLLFSVPAVKGVEFGDGFSFADKKGSEANDPFQMVYGKVTTLSNHNGGINGGITNGMPVLFRCVVKPTSSIYKKQNTINYQKKENALLQIEGRHDPAIIHRARVVVDSVAAIGLVDLFCERYGYLWMTEKN